MIPKRFPRLTYPKISARNAAGKRTSPILAIARIVRQPRRSVSTASVGRCQFRSTQTRTTDAPSTCPRNINLANTGRDAASKTELTNEIQDDDRIEDWIRITQQ